MALCRRSKLSHPCCTHPQYTPQKPRNRRRHVLSFMQVPSPTQQARETSLDFSSRRLTMRFLVSIRISCTKIPVSTCMEESTRMVSGRCFFDHPTLLRSIWLGRVKVCLDSRGIDWRNKISEVEHRLCDLFSDGYYATRPTRNWHQKYSYAN